MSALMTATASPETLRSGKGPCECRQHSCGQPTHALGRAAAIFLEPCLAAQPPGVEGGGICAQRGTAVGRGWSGA